MCVLILACFQYLAFSCFCYVEAYHVFVMSRPIIYSSCERDTSACPIGWVPRRLYVSERAGRRRAVLVGHRASTCTKRARARMSLLLHPPRQAWARSSAAMQSIAQQGLHILGPASASRQPLLGCPMPPKRVGPRCARRCGLASVHDATQQ